MKDDLTNKMVDSNYLNRGNAAALKNRVEQLLAEIGVEVSIKTATVLFKNSCDIASFRDSLTKRTEKYYKVHDLKLLYNTLKTYMDHE